MSTTCLPLDLQSAIASALTRLPTASGSSLNVALPEAIQSLLYRSRAHLTAAQATAHPPLRCIHHLACTGGTLICRCISALPNVDLLSEIDPLSRIGEAHMFAPTDMVRLLRFGSRPPSDAQLIEVFLAGLDAVYEEVRATGGTLVLRNHAHSHFHYGPVLPDRPSLRRMLVPFYATRDVITVRHPADSYISMQRNGWNDFSPSTLEEYCRRTHAFLDDLADVEIIRYEDFVATPQTVLQHLCEILELTYNPDFARILPAIQLSGNSGRSGDVIAPRRRKPLTESFIAEAHTSVAYFSLCRRLGYKAEV